jgi:hypothetical protein
MYLDNPPAQLKHCSKLIGGLTECLSDLAESSSRVVKPPLPWSTQAG